MYLRGFTWLSEQTSIFLCRINSRFESWKTRCFIGRNMGLIRNCVMGPEFDGCRTTDWTQRSRVDYTVYKGIAPRRDSWVRGDLKGCQHNHISAQFRHLSLHRNTGSVFIGKKKWIKNPWDFFLKVERRVFKWSAHNFIYYVLSYVTCLISVGTEQRVVFHISLINMYGVVIFSNNRLRCHTWLCTKPLCDQRRFIILIGSLLYALQPLRCK